MKKALLTFAVLGAAFLFPTPSHALDKQAEVRKAEAYMKKLDTAKARFLQIAPDGHQLIGTFYLDRPGKLRFEYDDPVKDFVVADGAFIYFYDSQLGEQSNAPIGPTLADFILRKDIKMSGDLEVTDIKEGGGLTQITIVQEADPGAGSITLGFQQEPYQLKKWRILDGAGAVTEVELFQLQQNVDLDKRLFMYSKPKGDKPRYNQ